MLSWHYVTAATYYAAESYDADKLYYLSDTGEIYKGSVPFSEAIVLVDDTGTGATFDTELAKITNPARRKLYVSKATLGAKTYNGTAWVWVIYPVVTGNSGDALDSTNTTNPVSGKAVAGYVSTALATDTLLSDLSWDGTTAVLTGTMKDGTTTDTVTLTGLGTQIDLVAKAGSTSQQTLRIKDIGGNVLSSVDLDLERFVQSAEYDPTTRTIKLYFDTAKTDYVTIDVSDLVSIYSVVDTDTVDLTATNIAPSVVIEGEWSYPSTMPATANEGDFCQDATTSKWYKYTSGAWVEDQDGPSSGSTELKADVKISTKSGNMLSVCQESGKVGLYVAATDLGGKLDVIENGTAGHLIVVDSTDTEQVADSGKAIGGSTLAGTPDASTVATEAAVKAYADGLIVTDLETYKTSDTKVYSAKTVYDALSWSTTM